MTERFARWVLGLASVLEGPQGEQNRLLVAAGLGPVYAERPLDAPDMINAKVADCPPGYRGKPPKADKTPPAPLDPLKRAGKSLDGTLTWDVAVQADGARRFVVTMASAGQPVTVQDLQVEAPAK